MIESSITPCSECIHWQYIHEYGIYWCPRLREREKAYHGEDEPCEWFKEKKNEST